MQHKEKSSNEYFISIDKSIYGKIKGVTDKKKNIQEDLQCQKIIMYLLKDLLEIESPYHSLTNGGHYTRVELANKLKGKFRTIWKKQ